MLEKNADVNCCFLCSVIFIEYYSTMHCNEVLQVCRIDPIYCDIFEPAEWIRFIAIYLNLPIDCNIWPCDISTEEFHL